MSVEVDPSFRATNPTIPSVSEISPQESLQQVVDSSVDRLIGFRFHEEAGLGEDVFRALFVLPKNADVPQKGIPLLVYKGLSEAAQHSLTGVWNPVPGRDYMDLVETPDRPYLIFAYDPVNERGWRPGRPNNPEIVPCTFHEVTSAWIHHRDFFLDEEGLPSFALVAGGTRLVPQNREEESWPDIRYFHKDAPFAGTGSIYNPVSGWKVMVRSPQIIPLGLSE